MNWQDAQALLDADEARHGDEEGIAGSLKAFITDGASNDNAVRIVQAVVAALAAEVLVSDDEVKRVANGLRMEEGLIRSIATAVLSVRPAPPVNEKILALADRIDYASLWKVPVLERPLLTQDQRDRMDAGVHLRRYASLLGEGRWRIFPPRPNICYSGSTLEVAARMARKGEKVLR